MEDYTLQEALQNVVGYLKNPIMARKEPELHKSAVIIDDYLKSLEAEKSGPKTYRSIYVKVSLKGFYTIVDVPTENYSSTEEAFSKAENDVRQLIDSGKIVLKYQGQEIPKEMIDYVYVDGNDLYDADFSDNPNLNRLSNGIYYEDLKTYY